MSPSESKLSAIREYAIECSISKVYGSDILCYVADESIQIHGGMGYATDTGVERGYRDARITKIYEGTNEVNRLLIVGELMKRAFQTKEIALLPALKRAPLKALASYFSFSSPSLEKRKDLLRRCAALIETHEQKIIKALNHDFQNRSIEEIKISEIDQTMRNIFFIFWKGRV